MNHQIKRPGFSYIFIFSTFFLFISAFSPNSIVERHIYQIESQSELLILGSSNVNKFTCDCSCERDFTQSSLEMNRFPEMNRFEFANARLKLATLNLDCGHKVMNKDLHATLMADEYPYISIELLEAEVLPQKQFAAQNQELRLETLTEITIAGQSCKIQFPVKAEKIDEARYQFTGQVDLLMTNFGLKPPKAMLGLIKVDNEISINLDLTVRITYSQ